MTGDAWGVVLAASVAGVVSLLVKAVDAKFGSEKTKLDEAAKIREDQRASIENLQREVQELHERVVASEREVTVWREKYLSTLTELTQHKIRADGLQARADELQQTVSELKDEVASLRDELKVVENGQKK